jgi:hypothetical protein
MLASGTPRIDAQFMFTNHKNVHKPGIEKRQRKLLEKIPFINSFLDPDEKILRVSTCMSPTGIVEQLTIGLMVAYINRALVVVTNKGVFHIPTTIGYNYRNSIAKFRYEDCKRLEGGRKIFAQYGNGKKERFYYIKSENGKKLKAFFKSLKIGGNAAKNTAAKQFLCPRCTKPLSPNVYQCGACRLAFKDMATAKKRSWLIPGGGYFYTGHPFLGFGDFIAEFVLLAMVVVGVSAMISGQPGGIGVVFMFGFFLLFEKLLTIHHAERYIKEYIPVEKTIKPQAAAA